MARIGLLEKLYKSFQKYRSTSARFKKKGRFKSGLSDADLFDYEQTPRNENMETETPEEHFENAEDYINSWLEMLQTIYNDTMTFCNDWRNKTLSSEDRQERYMCYTATPRLEATYRNVVSLLNQMVLEVGAEKTAQALSQDVELDYTLALVFMPPSEVLNQMSMTLEQVQGVFNRLIAEQNEDV